VNTGLILGQNSNQFKMENTSNNLWVNFQAFFKAELEITSIETLNNAWQSCSSRTKFYFDDLLPKVSEKMQFDFKKEDMFRVDGIFYKKTESGYTVPKIFIESENNADTADWEIIKLCSLNAPLKILFLCLEWTQSRKEQLTTDHWNFIIKAFANENQLIGHFAIIVAEKTDKFRFHSFAYNDKGDVYDIEKTIVEI